MKLLDRTGATPRTVGLVGLVLLVVTVLALPDPEPEPAPAPEVAEQPAPEPQAPTASDPQRLRESSRVRRFVPVYPGSTFTPMGLLEANGNMMEMGYFETKASLREVLDFYNKEFGKRSSRVVEQLAPNGGGTVNYYDDALGALVAITATPRGGKGEPRIMVFPSITASPDGIFVKAQAPEELPRPDGLVTVMRVDDHTTGPTQGSSTLTQVARGTPTQLAAFYRQEMPARGYELQSKGSTATAETLEFIRPGERVSLSISSMASQSGDNESVITVVTESKPKSKGT
ncbi:hypothetical protein P2318_12815 [Myxococcaceae bacterium GXIMD 01537]